MKLNFGVSDWYRQAPGIEKKEMIVEIPSTEELPKIPDYSCHYILGIDPNLRPSVGDLPSRPEHFYPSANLLPEEATARKVENFPKGCSLDCIVIPLQNTGEIREILLYWIEARKEWIGIIHSKWLEDSYGCDDIFSSPYALNEYYTKRLLAAFGILPWDFGTRFHKITLEEVRHFAPKRLEEMASSLKRKTQIQGIPFKKCPKCQGEIVCHFYPDTREIKHRHTWRHTCSNHDCDYLKEFTVLATPERVPEASGYGDGKEGGCPGHL